MGLKGFQNFYAQAGANYLLLNGQFVDLSDVDLFSLLDRVRQEV